MKIIVPDGMEQDVVNAICDSAGTGEIGDGKIFIKSLEEVVTIRTGERGLEAIT